MAACGIPDAVDDHADRALAFARAMIDEIGRKTGDAMAIRVGVHSGPVIGGLIGRSRFVYDVWGETVNIASRLEGAGVPSRIHLSEATRQMLRRQSGDFERRTTNLRGVGEITTYIL